MIIWKQKLHKGTNTSIFFLFKSFFNVNSSAKRLGFQVHAIASKLHHQNNKERKNEKTLT